MKKLYQKSEIWFAVLWIVVYVAGTSAADAASEAIGLSKSITLIFTAALSVVAWVWINREGLREKYGLCKTPFPAARFLYYVPLLVMMTCNLWSGLSFHLSAVEALLYMASMVCVGFLEEIIFRGFLFKAMSRDGLRSAVIVSSVTFGIGHIVNLFNGSGAELLGNLCQVVYAIAFGFLCVILFHRGKSLIPCIVAHSTINALSAFANEAAMTPAREIVIAAILTLIPLIYTGILLKTLPKTE